MNKKIVGTIIFIIIVTTVIVSNGVLFAKVTASANKAKIKPGEDVVITLTLSDIEGSEEGVSGFETVLKYDKEVFEQIKKEDMSSGWTLNYVPGQEFITVETTNAVTSGTGILTIRLKAKSNAKVGTTHIEFTNNKIYNLEESVNISVVPVSVTIEPEIVDIPTGPSEPGKDGGPEGGKETAPGEIPKTGAEETFLFGSMGALCMMIAAGTIIKFRK